MEIRKQLEEKDIEDIDELIKSADVELINQIIEEVLSRDDLYGSKRNEFIRQLSEFRERYNV